jgi:hypothetical protein
MNKFVVGQEVKVSAKDHAFFGMGGEVTKIRSSGVEREYCVHLKYDGMDLDYWILDIELAPADAPAQSTAGEEAG